VSKEKTYTVKIEVEFEVHTDNLDEAVNDITDQLEEVPLISMGGLVSVKSTKVKEMAKRNEVVVKQASGSCNLCTERDVEGIREFRGRHPQRNLCMRACKKCRAELVEKPND